MLLDLRTSTSAIYPLSYTTLFRSRPREPDAREIARQHVLALRSDTALDPLDEIVEGPLAHLAVESAVTRGAHHALHEQVIGPGGDGAAAVGLLEAERHPRVARLVQREQRHREPAGPLGIDRIRAGRAALLRRAQPAHARVELVLGETEAGIDAVPDVRGAGRARAEARLVLDVGVAVNHVQQIPVLQALEPQRQIVPGLVGAHQVLHDAVELTSALRVRAGHAERGHGALVEDSVERVPVRSVEQRHAADQLGRGGVRQQVVGDADAVDETAFGQAALVEPRPKLQRCDGDVAAHRLAVDDRPARLADLLQEQLADGHEVLDEEVRLILARAITGGDPGVPAIDDVTRDRRRSAFARPHATLDPVREHDEAAAPVRRHLEAVVRAAEHAAPGDGRALSLGAWCHERETQREQREERASTRHTGACSTRRAATTSSASSATPTSSARTTSWRQACRRSAASPVFSYAHAIAASDGT